ncbi:MAG: hypothetical protein D6723_14110 [Acidobacteria bacterium]|nr:MAG: hypothetical protein D6723_14110 [Acidobacteriota bacterium]
MSTVRLISEQEATGAVKAYFEAVKKRYGMDWVPNLSRAIAYRMDCNAPRSRAYARIIAPGALSRALKEMIAVAVSAVNACDY